MNSPLIQSHKWFLILTLTPIYLILQLPMLASFYPAIQPSFPSSVLDFGKLTPNSTGSRFFSSVINSNLYSGILYLGFDSWIDCAFSNITLTISHGGAIDRILYLGVAGHVWDVAFSSDTPPLQITLLGSYDFAFSFVTASRLSCQRFLPNPGFDFMAFRWCYFGGDCSIDEHRGAMYFQYAAPPRQPLPPVNVTQNLSSSGGYPLPFASASC